MEPGWTVLERYSIVAGQQHESGASVEIAVQQQEATIWIDGIAGVGLVATGIVAPGVASAAAGPTVSFAISG
jgi:hypothetical protein